MSDGERAVCTDCRYAVPLTGYCFDEANPLLDRLRDFFPACHASAFMRFAAGGDWRKLIHKFKYASAWRLARDMGDWYGACMARGGIYADADVAVPIPLHWRKRLKRGYNQSEYLAEGIARQLGIETDFRSVRRRRNNPSQALHRRDSRWQNVEDVFAVRHPERLAGRHILLVDDVFTSGATIVSCAETILAAVPSARISVAVLAVAEREDV